MGQGFKPGMNRVDQIILWVWAGIAVLVCLLSLDLGVGTLSQPGPGLFPFIFAIFLGAASVIYYAISCWGRLRLGRSPVEYGEILWRRPVFVIISLVIYSLFLSRIGFLVGTFFLLGILFNATPGAKREWKMALVGALATSMVSYVIFNKLLQIPLPRGIFGF